MSDAVLRVVADSSPLPLAVFDGDGALTLANRALRLLVEPAVIDAAHRERGFLLGRRVIMRTRVGGALALEVVAGPEETGSWVLRGEEPARRGGLTEASITFAPELAEGQTLLAMHLTCAGQRAAEQDRSVALLFLRLLGLERLAEERGRGAADDALALLDRCLVGNLRAADQLLPQDDGTRAIVAVVSGDDGATTLAGRVAAIFAKPLLLHGAERLFGIRIGVACAAGPAVPALEQAARDALHEAERSKRPFLSVSGPA